ncbi:hypothetical protein D3C78_1308580 [compost metagenome]
MRDLGEELGEPLGDVALQGGGLRSGAVQVGQLDPFVGAAAIGQVAPQGLPAIQAIAIHAAHLDQRQGFGDDHFGARGDQWNVHPELRRQLAGVRADGDHQLVAGDQAMGGVHAGHTVTLAGEAGDGAVLDNAAAEILQGPGIGL